MEDMLRKRIIYFVSSESQLQQLGRNVNSSNDTYIVILEKAITKKVRNVFPNAKISEYTEYIDEHSFWIEALETANEYFINLNHIQFGEEYIFKDRLGYNNHSLLEINSINYFSGHTELLAKVFLKVLTINKILDNIKPNRVVIVSPTSDWEEIILRISIDKSINVYDKRSYRDWISRKYFEHSFSLKLNIGGAQRNILVPLPILIVGTLLNGIKSLYPKKMVKFGQNHDILIYCINSKYLDVIVPLIKSIEQDRRSSPLLLLPQNFDDIEKLQKEPIDIQFVENYSNMSIYISALRAYVRILIELVKVRFNKTTNNVSFAYKNIDLSTIISREIKKSIYLSFSTIQNILLMKYIITKHKSKVLFMPHFSETVVKSFVIGAHEREISAICMHRGTVGLTSEYGTFNGDKILVPGQYSQKVFEKWGVPSERILPTGTPIFDGLIKDLDNRNYIKKQVRGILGISSDTTVITYLTQSFGSRFDANDRAEEIKQIFSTLKRIQDAFLIIKIHPTEEHTKIYSTIAKEINLKNYAIIRNEIKLDNLLLTSKIAITKNSTTGFNALLAGCQLIIIGFDQDNLIDNPFIDHNISEIARNSKDLEELIINIIKNKPNEKIKEDVLQYMKYHFNSLDAQSIQRIKDVIYNSF